MKVIIPLAGKGTRLRPHTFSKPKPLVQVAGKAVLGHILDKIITIPNIEEIIFITGDMEEQIKDYVQTNYKFKASFIRQKEQLGDGHAINLAHSHIDGEVLIAFVDTIFETDLSIIKNLKQDGIVWVKEVEDPRRFGVVMYENDIITKIVEKPDTPISKLAIIGLYYIKDGKKLFSYIAKLINEKITTKGEYRLADALGLMIKSGVKLKPVEVEVWADCGKPDTLLSTNKWLLENGHNKVGKIEKKNSVIIEPVFIDDGVKLSNCVVGPNVSIAKGSVIDSSIVRNSIIHVNSLIENVMLDESVIGDSAVIKDMFRKLNVGDNSEIVSDNGNDAN